MSKKESRRKLLKTIVAGGGVVLAGKTIPKSWSRPVVDSVMLPAHAQTSTACAIAGLFCWSTRNFFTSIQVLADGTVDIRRVRTRGGNSGRTWTGTGTTSNGASGGIFDIQTSLTAPPSDENPTNVRNFTGTVLCASSTISGVFDNPNNANPPRNFTASRNVCN